MFGGAWKYLRVVHLMSENTITITQKSIKTGAITSALAIACHGAYVGMTKSNQDFHSNEIESRAKFQFVSVGSSQLMTENSKGEIFAVSNSPWFWQWKSPDSNQARKKFNRI
jgi:hypothetical protein